MSASGKGRRVPLLLFSLLLFLPGSWLSAQEEDYSSLFDDPLTREDTGEEGADGEHGEGRKAAGSDGELEGTPEAGFRFVLWGEHEFDLHVPLMRNQGFEDPLSPGFTNDFGMETGNGDLMLVSGWSLDLVMTGTGSLADAVKMSPLENFLSFHSKTLKITAGYQYYAWGAADEQNPTDNINPRNYADQAEKFPILSTSLTLYPTDSLSISWVYVPFEQTDEFPIDIVEAVPRAIFNSTVEEEKKICEKPVPFDPGSFLAGAKLSFFFPAFDFSLSYLYDLDPFFTPVIELASYEIMPGFQAYRVESLELERLRVHRIGFDIKTSADIFGIWLEACLNLTEDCPMSSYRVRNPYLAWTAGLDFNYGKNSEFYLNVQSTGRWVFRYDDNFFRDYPNGTPDSASVDDEAYMDEYYYRMLTSELALQREGLELGLCVKADWPLRNDTWIPSLTALYLFPFLYDRTNRQRYGSLYLKPEIEIKPADCIYIQLGAELYFSWHRELPGGQVTIDRGDRIGRRYDDCNLYIGIGYSWSHEDG